MTFRLTCCAYEPQGRFMAGIRAQQVFEHTALESNPARE
jgi:hypothetical protein